MKKEFKRFYIWSVLGILLASVYPIYMGVRVITDMVSNGTVMGEDYPKYIIPYTPVSLAVLLGVLLMPAILKYAKRFALFAASLMSVSVFFLSELLLENKVIVTDTVETTLESWQVYMCYVPPQSYETRTWRTVDVLIGEYSPTFKLHFYLIAIVLILTLLNSFYGFGKMILTGNKKRQKALVLQSVSTLIFLALCILACFTAFFRDGELTVAPVSAALMSIFFVTFGTTAGLYAGSFLLEKKRRLAILLPAAISGAVALVMYIGELFLLSGHLYRFGTGFFFNALGPIVLAPVDLLVLLVSGALCALFMSILTKKTRQQSSPRERENP